MPDEIIMMLLKYVHGMDRVNLGSTCKRMRYLVLNSGLLWESRVISWDIDLDQCATLAPQIGKLVIVLNAQRNMDDFCFYLFRIKGSHTNIIHIIYPKMTQEHQRLNCWLRNEYLLQYYEIYFDSVRLDILENFNKVFIWAQNERFYLGSKLTFLY